MEAVTFFSRLTCIAEHCIQYKYREGSKFSSCTLCFESHYSSPQGTEAAPRSECSDGPFNDPIPGSPLLIPASASGTGNGKGIPSYAGDKAPAGTSPYPIPTRVPGMNPMLE